MNILIAACGLDCSQCEAYKITLANDRAAMEDLVVKWRAEYNSPEMTVESVICDGCMVGERHGGYCAECGVRRCALARGVANCAYCPDYGCETVQKFWQMAPQAKVNLDAQR